MGVIDKFMPEICLFQLNGIKHFCPAVACIVKHTDPQINSVRGCSISSQLEVKVDVLCCCYLIRVQIYSINEYTASVKL